MHSKEIKKTDEGPPPQYVELCSLGGCLTRHNVPFRLVCPLCNAHGDAGLVKHKEGDQVVYWCLHCAFDITESIFTDKRFPHVSDDDEGDDEEEVDDDDDDDEDVEKPREYASIDDDDDDDDDDEEVNDDDDDNADVVDSTTSTSTSTSTSTTSTTPTTTTTTNDNISQDDECCVCKMNDASIELTSCTECKRKVHQTPVKTTRDCSRPDGAGHVCSNCTKNREADAAATLTGLTVRPPRDDAEKGSKEEEQPRYKKCDKMGCGRRLDNYATKLTDPADEKLQLTICKRW
jgi:hypothetical protein